MNGVVRWPVARVGLAALLGASMAPTPAFASGGHVHDGLYARASLGPSWLDFERNTRQDGAPGTISYAGSDSSVSGVALAADVMIGGTPFPRVVFAGLLHAEVLTGARLVTADGATHPLAGPLVFTLVAPTVDLYTDERSGLHYGLGAGFAAVTGRFDDPPFRSLAGIGPGFTLHVGYDFWTAPEWSFGLSGRGIFAAVSREQSAAGIVGHERDSVATATVFATLLYQ
ncbi:MAG TPA: hypothetical protein VHE30_19235 [Polyangiaceae bacterium]|nr:hypothetical protein [Polyangiaceae bacterium]